MNVISRALRTTGRTVKGVATATAEVPAPALVVSAIGLFGLVDWPVVLAVSGGAFVWQRVNRTPDESSKDAAVSDEGARRNGSPQRASRTAPKTARSPASTA